MSSDMPQFIAPERLAEAGARIEGRLELHKMTRLAELLMDSRGMVDLKLAFHRSEDGFIFITGRYETTLQLVCQRCLEPITVNLAHTINVSITFEGAALKKLPATLEPLILQHETIALADFVEDEILLGLPISPMHVPQECAAVESAMEHAHVGSNPFHILKELKSG